MNSSLTYLCVVAAKWESNFFFSARYLALILLYELNIQRDKLISGWVASSWGANSQICFTMKAPSVKNSVKESDEIAYDKTRTQLQCAYKSDKRGSTTHTHKYIL
jgi:hypothetical protein